MNRRHDIPAIVLNLSINGLGVARALGRHGVPVIGLSEGKPLPGGDSRYVREVWRYEGGDAGLVDLLCRQGGGLADRPVLFPITDSCVLVLAERMEELREHYRLAMPDPAIVRSAMSKRGFADWAEKLDLPVPRTVFVEDPSRIARACEAISYPCIVKPEFRSVEFALAVTQKTFRCDSPQELLAAYESFCKAEPRAIAQEWIPGGDGDVYFCLQYYDRQARPLVSFCGRKIRQWPPLCGGTASCEPVESPEMEELTSRFFTALGFYGLCSMEYKKDPTSGRLVMVEPTIARTDWQSAVADINGVEIPYFAYCDQVGAPGPAVRRTSRRYKWVRWSADKASVGYYRRRGELGLWGWLWSIRPPRRWAVWSLSDPLPYAAALARRIVRKARKLLGVLGIGKRPAERGR